MRQPRNSRYDWREITGASTYEEHVALLDEGEELVVSANPNHFSTTPTDKKHFGRLMEVRGAKAYAIKLKEGMSRRRQPWLLGWTKGLADVRGRTRCRHAQSPFRGTARGLTNYSNNANVNMSLYPKQT